jgi:hypothetical protein
MAMSQFLPEGILPSQGGGKKGAPRKALIGQSPAILRFAALLHKAAKSRGTVLFAGEVGSGKGLAAEVLHRDSPLADAPLGIRPPKGSIGCEEAGGEGGREEGGGVEESFVQSPFAPGRARR